MKLITTLILLAYLFPLDLKAQYYEFEIEKLPYESIDNPEYENKTDTSGGIVVRAIMPFATENYYAFGQPLDSGFSIGTNGYVLSQNSKNSFTFDPFLVDLYFNQKSSRISFKEFELERDTVFEIEWYHLALEEHDSNDYIDFKIRFYRKSRTIEYHYGPSEINTKRPFSSNQAIINMSYLSFDFMTVVEQYFFGGNPESPKWLQWPQFEYVNGFPSEGTVYRFIDKKAMDVPDMLKKTDGTPISYWFESSEQLTVKSEQKIDAYRIHDLNGKLIKQSSVGATEFSLPKTALNKGQFILKLLIGEQVVFHRIVNP